jgi:hypothetical protein
MDIQPGHGHAAWTWTCCMDMDMQPGHLHAAWTWTCCLDIGIQPGLDMDMYIELDIDAEFHRKKIKELYKTLFTLSFWMNILIISLFIFLHECSE